LYLGSTAASCIGMQYGVRFARYGPGSALPGGKLRFVSAHCHGLRFGGGLRILMHGARSSTSFDRELNVLSERLADAPRLVLEDLPRSRGVIDASELIR
jgi:hypothetical protein